jgi:Zn-finger nucleic acid-binding protein
MFVGSEFCGHCGAKAVQAAVSEGDDLGNCPRCRRPLELLQIDTTSLRECQKCNGMWSDVETFERICSTREQQSAVLGFIGERELNAEPLSKVSYVPCPDCKQLMNRSNFAKASGVIIDTCKKHGVWFDAGELPQIIEFIQKGGMDIARQRERSEIDADRNRLKDEQRNLAVLNRRLDDSEFSSRNDEFGIRGFLSRVLG